MTRRNSRRAICALGVITVHELETAVLHNAFPQRMGPGVMNLVPTHVRHFETLAAGRIVQGRSEPAHLACKDTQAVGAAVIIAVVAQGQHAETAAEKAIGAGGRADDVVESA